MASDFQKKKGGRIFKLVLLGDGGVGKTSLRERFLGRGFQASYLMTVGADFAIYETMINNEKITLQIWDLAGQHRFKEVRMGFYAGSIGAILVYDVTRRESADDLTNWYKELIENARKDKVFLMTVANKIDLRGDPEAMTEADGKAVAKRLQKNQKDPSLPVSYVETSAKDNINVPEAFLKLAEIILSSVEANKPK